MIENSVLLSPHHYYVVLFEAPQLKTLQDVLTLFDDNKHSENVNLPNDVNNYFIHLQLEIGKVYGNEILLQPNFSISRDATKYYWYDFYLGKIDNIDKHYYYICYPYSKLGKYIENCFASKNCKKIFFKPMVSKVLDYIKNRGISGMSEIELNGFDIDITKYSAEVKEETNANRINIIGSNPLNSRVFDILNKDNKISIEPISLKLKCSKSHVGSIEPTFDRLGNYRFWLRRNAQETVISMMPHTFEFFMGINSLEQSSYINSLTLLEDDQ